jgi:hypothetical protein
MGLIKKLLLTREIISRTGVVHFRRYRLLETPILRFYIHQILESDKDGDLHDHPWNLISIILKGGYIERFWDKKRKRNQLVAHSSFDIFRRSATDFHCIDKILKPVWTFVIAYGKRREWGYQTEIGWVDNKTYRQLKNVLIKNALDPNKSL